ncbi:response regulator [Puia sp. P3]|uniref:response regulator n=1 Tax=Puia sp. P3 TaxID=3423952 RepID=UPI003D676CC1
MNTSVLIVEDEFIEANNLEEILVGAGYTVTGIARSVSTALNMIEKRRPGIVMLDIQLQGNLTGIDLGVKLREMKIAFVYLSANSNKVILDAAKATRSLRVSCQALQIQRRFGHARYSLVPA